MNLLFPDQGLTYQLRQILTPGVKYRLYANDVIPDLGTVLADLTEAAWPGYGGPITRVWTDYTTNGVSGHNGFAVAPPITFGNTSGSAQLTFGYYVTDPAVSPTLLLAVCRFDSAPVSIPNGGNTIVIPTWGDFSQLM